MKQKFYYLLMIFCIQLLFSCSNKNNTDPFLGEWTSYDKDLRISKTDTAYQVEYLDKSGQVNSQYIASKVGDLLSYRDNGGIGRQIKIYVPVDTTKHNDSKGNPVLDYNDTLHIRLMTNGEGDFYKKFKTTVDNSLKGFAGAWKMRDRKLVDVYSTITIDSTSKGIQVAWQITSYQTDTTYASFNQNILNVPGAAIDGGTNVTYFKDCDCLTAGNDKYYRYNDNDAKLLGDWQSNDGATLKISKDGDYYLLRYHQNQGYTFDFLIKFQDNELKGGGLEPIRLLSPGVITLSDGGEIKMYNSSKFHDTYIRNIFQSSITSSTSSTSSNTSSSTTTTKSFSGNVGNLKTSYSLTWNSDGTIIGTYYYPNKPNTTYTLKGSDLGNGKIQLSEYTGSNVTANCYLTLQGNCYVGQMNNTDGRAFKMTMCQ